MTIQNASDYSQYGASGLEEMTAADITVPRLQIVHKDGQFKDSLSGQLFNDIQVVILGLVKQRSLWHTKVDDNDRPMCRSVDFEFGVPNETEQQPANKRFPWAASGFNPADYPANTEGVKKLPCEGCALKDWGSHPDGNKPYCSEQWVMPVFYNSTPEDGEGAESWVPAIMSFQKSSLKPLKSYLSAFQRVRQPAFTAVTKITLNVFNRGQTDYSIPTFVRGSRTKQEEWPEYAANYDTMKDFLRNGRQAFEENEEAATSNVPQQPVREDPWAAAPQAAAAQPTPAPAPAPAQPAPAQPAPSQTVQGEVVQQPAPAAAPAQPAPAPAQPAPSNSMTDDLPF